MFRGVSVMDPFELPLTFTTTQVRYVFESYHKLSDMRNSVPNGDTTTFFLSWHRSSLCDLIEVLGGYLERYSHSVGQGKWLVDRGVSPVNVAGILSYFDISRARDIESFSVVAGLCRDKVIEKDYIDYVIDLISKELKEEGSYTEEEVVRRTAFYFGASDEVVRGLGIRGVTRDSIVEIILRREWNGSIKKLMYNLGNDLGDYQRKPLSYYSKVYVARFTEEWDKNLRGTYKGQAISQKKGTSKDYIWNDGYISGQVARAYYEGGFPTSEDQILLEGKGKGVYMLSPPHIVSRVKRYVVKRMLGDFYGFSAHLIKKREV